MGQKVHPIGMRLGINKEWSSRWYATRKQFSGLLAQDILIRDVLEKELKKARAPISEIKIDRIVESKQVKVSIFTSREGAVLGKGGELIETLQSKISKAAGLPKSAIKIIVNRVGKPELSAKLTAENIVAQLESRGSFRKAMKTAMKKVTDAGAKGVRVTVSGRLNGAEIARSEWYREGRVPLHTLRADIDYYSAQALTTYGIIGVKVWICR